MLRVLMSNISFLVFSKKEPPLRVGRGYSASHGITEGEAILNRGPGRLVIPVSDSFHSHRLVVTACEDVGADVASPRAEYNCESSCNFLGQRALRHD